MSLNWIQYNIFFGKIIKLSKKSFWLRPRLPRVLTQRVASPRALSLATSLQVPGLPLQVENSFSLSFAKIGHFSSLNAFLWTPLQQFPLISFPATLKCLRTLAFKISNSTELIWTPLLKLDPDSSVSNLFLPLTQPPRWRDPIRLELGTALQPLSKLNRTGLKINWYTIYNYFYSPWPTDNHNPCP